MRNFQSLLPLHLLHNEDFVLVELLVHGQLSCLSECLSATFIRASKGLLSSVNVSMLLQVLPESKLFKANDAHKLLCWLMSSQVASEGEASSELFITVGLFTFEWSFHVSEFVVV
jgi:hypothetical protein